MSTRNKFSPEVRARAVRMVEEHRGDYASDWTAINSIAGKIGCTTETLRRWVREEASQRAGSAQGAGARGEGASPSQRDSAQGISIFCDGGARPPRQMVMAFIDAHRDELDIEPICRQLAIAPSSYHEHALRLADPGRRPARARRDDAIRQEITRVHEASVGLYGTRKVWHQLRREGIEVTKCTVERLMRAMGLAGIRRGKTSVTTLSNPKAPCPLDKVNRSNALWVVDFTYVHSWAGFIYVAFVIVAFAHRVVGWKVSTSATAGLVLDALEQAIHARRPRADNGLIHHSDTGVQYLAMNYTQRLAEAELVSSVGSVGDSYDNALAETINGLYKAEVIWRQRSWPNASAVEIATLRWVDWFNNHRLFGLIGHIPSAGAEANYYAAIETLDMLA